MAKCCGGSEYLLFSLWPQRTNFFYHGRLDWDPLTPAGRYVRENCKPLYHYLQDKDPAHVDLLDLVEKMLEYIPEQRVTLSEALRHPFFTHCKRQLRAMALMKTFDEDETPSTTTNNAVPDIPPVLHEEPPSAAHPFDARPLDARPADARTRTNARTPTPPSVTHPPIPPVATCTGKSKYEEKVGLGLDRVDSSKKQVHERKGEKLEGGENERKGDGLMVGAVASTKLWAGLPSANYSLDTSDVEYPSMLPPFPVVEESSASSRLEDSGIVKKLERQAAVKQESLRSPEDEEERSPRGKPKAAKRTDSKGDAPVKARRRRRESKREKTPPLSPLEAAKAASLDSVTSEGDDGNVFAFQADEEPSLVPSKLSSKRAELGVSDLVVPLQPEVKKDVGIGYSGRIPLLTFGGKMSIDVTPASPLNQDPPEINESLGMGHFYNQSTQTPERFYREMCPSPHEFSSRPLGQREKGTQTPAQFYPPIPTQDVGIDAGQFPEAPASLNPSLDSSLLDEGDRALLIEEESVRVSAVPVPVRAGIFLTQGPEEEEEKHSVKVSAPACVGTGSWKTSCSLELPESPVCFLPHPEPQPSPSPIVGPFPAAIPAAHITEPPPIHPPSACVHPPAHQPPSSYQPPVIVQQPQTNVSPENAFEAWIETQSAFEEVPGVVMSAPAMVFSPQPQTPSLPVTASAAVTPPVVEQKARAKRRRERRRCPGQGSESSAEAFTPPSTPTMKVKSASNEQSQAAAVGADRGKKKVPPPNVSACEELAQAKGGKQLAGQIRGDKPGKENGLYGGGRSEGGERKRQEFMRSGQVSDANDDFVLASDNIQDSAR